MVEEIEEKLEVLLSQSEEGRRKLPKLASECFSSCLSFPSS